MPRIYRDLMHKLYGRDIWEDFKFRQSDVDHQGWNGKNDTLRRLALVEAKPVILDIGVWKGESTITIATMLRDANIDGCVVSIDTFLGSSEHWGLENHLFKRNVGRPNIYETFLANVFSLDLQRYVIPFPQNASAAAKILQGFDVKASAVHIDASHEYDDVMSDSIKYWNLLKPGGILVGDDYDESWADVVRAAHDFSRLVSRPLSVQKPKWILQK